MTDQREGAMLVFRAVGPAKEVIETIRLYLVGREGLTVREMMELEEE